ncbi:MAG: hypothetical protein ABGW98_11405 [Myxococcales bacterium]
MRVFQFLTVLMVLIGTADVALAALATATDVPARLAYLDPGSGSFVVQALIAMFVGIAVTSRIYWSKIKSVLGFSSSSDLDDDEDEDDV